MGVVVFMTAVLAEGCFSLDDPCMDGIRDSAAATEDWLRGGGLGEVSRTPTSRKNSSVLGSGVAGLLIYVKKTIITN